VRSRRDGFRARPPRSLRGRVGPGRGATELGAPTWC